ncbi:MAG: phosphoribosylamine--glycine ligase [Candidatus Omnitrophica bacterium]|nr:phosphoribosylamine--glycine ligase [Candidatus Omnitrophota bacterium]
MRKILVIGSGGREHTLVWKIAQSELADKIFCAPGNGGIERLAECINIETEDMPGLLDFALHEKIDLTVVGPELPLAFGLVDQFEKAGLRIFGPTKKAARLESSKVFAKELMRKYEVPTANFRIFEDAQEAKNYINQTGVPCVVKADGLAAGKGVIVCETAQEAEKAVNSIMEDRIFGDAGKRIIIEDYLEGEEASIIVLTDSNEAILLASSQDYKRVFDGDKGKNTGGMGAYSPTPFVTKDLFQEIRKQIINPTITGLVKEGIDYKGVLYFGLMITKDGPRVLEFNVRFGDPETEAVLPRLNSDLVEAMLATTNRQLAKFSRFGGLQWDNRACICVVCASGGYPGKYEKGKEICGLEEAQGLSDIVVFHAGTLRLGSTALTTSRSGQANDTYKYTTNGGRVLGVTGLGNTIKEARERTYQAVKMIHFEGMHCRRDIGDKAIKN